MRKPNRDRELMRKVAAAAQIALPEFPPLERADVLEGIALILIGEAREAASYAAFAIRKAEAAQLTFANLFSQSQPDHGPTTAPSRP